MTDNPKEINSKEEFENQYPSQGGFLLIPTYVADDPRLDDSEKMLYGRLNALSNEKGYCWASTKHLASLTGCKERELKYRLEKLKKYDHIRSHSWKDGMKWVRQIWVSNHYSQIKFTKGTHVHHRRAHTCPSKGHICAPELDKQELDNSVVVVDARAREENKKTFEDSKPSESQDQYLTYPGRSGPETVYLPPILASLQRDGYELAAIREVLDEIESYHQPVSSPLHLARTILASKKQARYTNSQNERKPPKYEPHRQPKKRKRQTVSQLRAFYKGLQELQGQSDEWIEQQIKEKLENGEIDEDPC